MQCVVLAGGLGTRMQHIAPDLPKALIPIHQRPFLDYQLSWMSRHGVDHVTLVVGYKAEKIREYLQKKSFTKLRVELVDEGEELRGTAGALRTALEADCLDSKFLLVYGDSYLPVDFNEIWQAFVQSNAPALMTVFRNRGLYDKSNVQYENGQVVLYDKQYEKARAEEFDFIDYGLSCLSRDLIQERVPCGKAMGLAQLFHQLSLEKKLAGFEVNTRFYEIGSPAGLRDFSEYISLGWESGV